MDRTLAQGGRERQSRRAMSRAMSAALRCFLPAVVLAFATAPAAARIADAPRPLSACLHLIESDPDRALEEALIWVHEGGGLPADQCAAQAMVAQGAYREAATRFEEMAASRRVPNDAERAGLRAQAGNAWLLAGLADRARPAFDAALALSPDDPDILFDRARAHGMARDFAAAEKDLTAVLRRDPGRDDALTLRASARRALGNLQGAREDIEAALARNGRNQEALVERGGLRLDAGDVDGARADFLSAALVDAETPAGQAAQDALARIDVRTQ